MYVLVVASPTVASNTGKIQSVRACERACVMDRHSIHLRF